MKERIGTEQINNGKVNKNGPEQVNTGRTDHIMIEGIELDCSNVSEQIEAVIELFRKDGLHMIEEICLSGLEKMEHEEGIAEIFRRLDFALIGDTGILTAAGMETVKRRLDIENLHFFKELMFFLEESKKSVFIIGMDAGLVNRTEGYIRRKYPRIEMLGTKVYVPMENLEGEDSEDEGAEVVNEMNSAGPDVILSVLPTPEQEIFLAKNYTRISAGMWYGLGSERLEPKNSITDRLRKAVRIRRLRKRLESKTSETGNV